MRCPTTLSKVLLRPTVPKRERENLPYRGQWLPLPADGPLDGTAARPSNGLGAVPRWYPYPVRVASVWGGGSDAGVALLPSGRTAGPVRGCRSL